MFRTAPGFWNTRPVDWGDERLPVTDVMTTNSFRGPPLPEDKFRWIEEEVITPRIRHLSEVTVGGMRNLGPRVPEWKQAIREMIEHPDVEEEKERRRWLSDYVIAARVPPGYTPRSRGTEGFILRDGIAEALSDYQLRDDLEAKRRQLGDPPFDRPPAMARGGTDAPSWLRELNRNMGPVDRGTWLYHSRFSHPPPRLRSNPFMQQYFATQDYLRRQAAEARQVPQLLSPYTNPQ